MHKFNVGDMVAYKTNPQKKYCVVGKNEQNIILSFDGEKIEANPVELLTAEETKKENEPLMPAFG